MNKPKLIVINGFAAAGKTTIAQKYIAEHSLALALEADQLVDNIGDWQNHIPEVRELSFAVTKSMLQAYLPFNHDVVLPYLVTDAAELEAFETIAHACGASYYEFVLYSERSHAIARLLQRGSWGEATSPPLTEQDLPEIEGLLDRMEAALIERPNAIRITLKDKKPDTTYRELLSYLGN